MRRIYFMLSLAMAFSVASPVDAATISVPDEYPTIQAAIDAANTGDTVLVSPGRYVENINFLGKAITVTSKRGPGVTTIDGNQAGSVVTFSSGEGLASVVRGFTLRNGKSGYNGGGVNILYASPIITGNVITGNIACSGIGISVSFGSPLIQGNVITGNTTQVCSGGWGGGLYVGGAATAQILDNVISHNAVSSGFGGGIALFAAGTPTIQGNVISNNSASGGIPCSWGGGIVIANFSDAAIINNLIVGNSAGCGGGIYWLPSGQRGPLLVNNTIADNDSPQGSGIFAGGFDAQTLLINNVIIGKAGQTAVFCGDFNDLNSSIFKFNDVFSPSGTAYGGMCTNQTGVNGNISADPLFVGGDHGDYHVLPGSPIIDSGDNTAPNLPTADLDGAPRVQDGDGDGEAVVDMGAYEFPASTLDTVAIGKAVFFNYLSSLLVTATSSAMPNATLSLTVPGCLTGAPMTLREDRDQYVYAKRVKSCGNLDGKTVTVTSSHGGVATGTIR